jgi:hypothetical protein
MQFETVLVARTPRVNCPELGVKTIGGALGWQEQPLYPDV